MKNLGLLIGSLVLTLVIVIAVAFLFTNKANAPILPSDPITVEGEELHVRGKEDAPITIVEFSDFQCPACKATQPLLEEILQNSSDSARLIYRHFPLRSIHKNAFAAAKAAEAAHNQSKFFEYHDKLFDSQLDWEGEADPAAKFEAYAKDLGLDVEKFKKDYQDKTLEERIVGDENDGNSLGVNSTPTFYVNNVKTEVSDLQSAVESLKLK